MLIRIIQKHLDENSAKFQVINEILEDSANSSISVNNDLLETNSKSEIFISDIVTSDVTINNYYEEVSDKQVIDEIPVTGSNDDTSENSPTNIDQLVSISVEENSTKILEIDEFSRILVDASEKTNTTENFIDIENSEKIHEEMNSLTIPSILITDDQSKEDLEIQHFLSSISSSTPEIPLLAEKDKIIELIKETEKEISLNSYSESSQSNEGIVFPSSTTENTTTEVKEENFERNIEENSQMNETSQEISNSIESNIIVSTETPPTQNEPEISVENSQENRTEMSIQSSASSGSLAALENTPTMKREEFENIENIENEISELKESYPDVEPNLNNYITSDIPPTQIEEEKSENFKVKKHRSLTEGGYHDNDDEEFSVKVLQDNEPEEEKPSLRHSGYHDNTEITTLTQNK